MGSKAIRVNAIAPGYTDTGMTQERWIDGDGNQDLEARNCVWEDMAEKVSLGSIGQPEDVACAMLYLACDASRYATGQVIRPNGGVAMP